MLDRLSLWAISPEHNHHSRPTAASLRLNTSTCFDNKHTRNRLASGRLVSVCGLKTGVKSSQRRPLVRCPYYREVTFRTEGRDFISWRGQKANVTSWNYFKLTQSGMEVIWQPRNTVFPHRFSAEKDFKAQDLQ